MAQNPHDAGNVRKTDVEAKQASHRQMNFRTLIISLIVLAVIGAVMLTIFWETTPQEFGAQSNGVEQQPTATETAPAPAAGQTESAAPADDEAAPAPDDSAVGDDAAGAGTDDGSAPADDATTGAPAGEPAPATP